MRIDWIRVYQPSDSINIGCDPTDFPTAAYIDEYASPLRSKFQTLTISQQVRRGICEREPHDMGRRL